MEDATKIWRALYQYGERTLIQKLWEVDLMLYLVVSTPHPSKPEDVKGVRAKWWAWAEDLKSEGKAICYFARVGRGAVVIFDVTSNDELHELLTQWLNMVPVTFDTYPLVSREQALQFLK